MGAPRHYHGGKQSVTLVVTMRRGCMVGGGNQTRLQWTVWACASP
jgi:hypothetical protein